MRNLRKAVAALLVVVMILGTVAFGAAVPEDVIGTQYEEAVATLAALDVLEGRDDGTFDAEGDITRAEFAAVAIRALGLEASVPAASYKPTEFNDCDNVQWAWGYINLASKQGIINGYGDGTFGPNDKVTYEQAVAMLVRVLGYEVMAQRKGGWPDGYLVVAAENKITKGVPVEANNQPAKRGTVALLTFNSLEVFLAEVTYIDANGNDVTTVTTKTLLADKLEVTKKYGVLVSTEYATLVGNKNNAGEISLKEAISQNSYYAPITAKNVAGDVTDLLGCAVVYYLRYDRARNEYTALSVQEDLIKNDVITVDAADLATSTLSTFKYWEDKVNDREPEEEDITGSTVIVNGAVDSTPSDATVNPATGSVKIIDNNNDGVYDYVFVSKYIDYVVDSVDADRNFIEFKGGDTAVLLDPEDSKKYTFSITLDGEEIGLADLKEWDVLSVVADKDDNGQIGKGTNVAPWFTNAKFTVTRNTVEGKIDEYNVADGNLYILDAEDNSTRYKFGPDFDTNSVSLGDEGVFYLNYEGKVAYADTTRALGNYAYVIDAYYSNTSASAVTNLRLLTSDGELVDVSTSKFIQLNGTRARSVDTQNGNAPVVAASQIIAYEENDGIVTSIDTAVNNHNGSYTKLFSEDFVKAQSYYNKGMFDGMYMIDDSTIVFEIATSGDEEDMAVKTKSAFTERKKYDVALYDVDKNGVAAVVLYTPVAGEEEMSSHLALVKKIATTTAGGKTINRLTAYQAGTEIVLKTTNTGVFAAAYSDSRINTELGQIQGIDVADPTAVAGYGATAKNYAQWKAAFNIAYNFFPGNLILYSANSQNEIDSAMKIYPAEAPALIGFDANDTFTMIPYMAFDNQYKEKNACSLEIIVGTVADKNTATNSLVIDTALFDGTSANDPWDMYQTFAPATVRAQLDSSSKVYVVDTNKKANDADVQVIDNSLGNIAKGDKVVIRKYEGGVRDVVIYKNYDVSVYGYSVY